MYLDLVWAALCNLLYFALHVTCSGTFPKPLSPRQERECLIQIRQGDTAAKNQLIEHNLRLVAHIVKKYYAISGEQEDLISIGTIGLIKAASTFDYEKSRKFSTYASKCIENEILMHFRSRRKSASDVSLSDPVDTDREGNSLTLMDIMSEEIDMVGQIDLQLKSAQLRRYIESFLDDREREIIRLVAYGYSNKEIAAELFLSEGTIRNYLSGILDKLHLRDRTQVAIFYYQHAQEYKKGGLSI